MLFSNRKSVFTRTRKLDLEKLVGLILSFSESKNFAGYKISAGTFFRDLSESLNAKFSAPNRAGANLIIIAMSSYLVMKSWQV